METKGVKPKHRLQLLFKSYYVVWKPQDKKKIYEACQSLNRTMQYGN